MAQLNITEMRQQMGEMVTELRKRQDGCDERGKETAEETEWFDNHNKAITALERRIKREEEIQEKENAMTASTSDLRKPDLRAGWDGIHYNSQGLKTPSLTQIDTHVTNFLQGYLRCAKSNPVIEQHHKDAALFLKQDFRQREVHIPIIKNYKQFRSNYEREYRDLNIVTSTKGVETIPEGFVRQLDVAMLAKGGMREVSDVIRTDGEGDLPWPTVNDTSNVAVILDEATDFGSSVDPVFGQVIFKKFKYSTRPILVSTEILQDSAFDLAARIAELIADRMVRGQNAHFSTGGGTTLPKGILVAATAFAAADNATLSGDDFIGLEHSVDPEYRRGARFMFSDPILSIVRKLKETSTSNYIWQPGLQAGVPDRLLGYPYTINQNFPTAIANSAKVAAFGDFMKYKIRDVATLRLIRLDELYAATDQVAFIAYLRSDGNLVDAGTHPVKYLQMQAS